MSLKEILEDPPDYLITAQVVDLLIALPRYGQVKADGLLGHCRILPSATLGGLSPRQRRDLIALL